MCRSSNPPRVPPPVTYGWLKVLFSAQWIASVKYNLAKIRAAVHLQLANIQNRAADCVQSKLSPQSAEHNACQWKSKHIGWISLQRNHPAEYLRITALYQSIREPAAPSCDTAVCPYLPVYPASAAPSCETATYNNPAHYVNSSAGVSKEYSWTPAYPENSCASVSKYASAFMYIFAHCVFTHVASLRILRYHVQWTCSTHSVKLQMHPTFHIEYELVSIKYLCLVVLYLTLQIHLCLVVLYLTLQHFKSICVWLFFTLHFISNCVFTHQVANTIVSLHIIWIQLCLHAHNPSLIKQSERVVTLKCVLHVFPKLSNCYCGSEVHKRQRTLLYRLSRRRRQEQHDFALLLVPRKLDLCIKVIFLELIDVQVCEQVSRILQMAEQPDVQLEGMSLKHDHPYNVPSIPCC